MSIQAKAKHILRLVRRYGIPNEETFVIPVFSLVILTNLADKNLVEVNLAFVFTAIVWIICGFWLGISSNTFYVIKITLRIWMMAIFSVAGYAAITEASYPKNVYIYNVGSVGSNLGLIFYCSSFFGYFVQQILLSNLTDKQVLIVARRKAMMRRFLMEIFSLKEEDLKLEIILARFVKIFLKYVFPFILFLYASSRGWKEIIKYMSAVGIFKQP